MESIENKQASQLVESKHHSLQQKSNALTDVNINTELSEEIHKRDNPDYKIRDFLDDSFELNKKLNADDLKDHKDLKQALKDLEKAKEEASYFKIVKDLLLHENYKYKHHNNDNVLETFMKAFMQGTIIFDSAVKAKIEHAKKHKQIQQTEDHIKNKYYSNEYNRLSSCVTQKVNVNGKTVTYCIFESELGGMAKDRLRELYKNPEHKKLMDKLLDKFLEDKLDDYRSKFNHLMNVERIKIQNDPLYKDLTINEINHMAATYKDLQKQKFVKWVTKPNFVVDKIKNINMKLGKVGDMGFNAYVLQPSFRDFVEQELSVKKVVRDVQQQQENLQTRHNERFGSHNR